MNVFARSARVAVAAAKPARLARFYASEASVTDKLRLTFVLPHKAIYKATDVQQVNLAATSGDMGILANHVPTIEQLNPGVVEVVESAEVTKKFFVSGGFATINPDSSLNINAVEAAPLEDFSLENVQAGLAEAQRALAGNGSEVEKAEAKIEVEFYEALQSALTK
ncbi:ATP synthase F1 subcomplex delta subunit ATP16 [Phycomyces blakesleeanus]|uniref:ATP synthase subunit delta, mitochondrial n=2 Tax=Phycomyces blakesleeanus TaxID=4837 RepID=A0A167QBH4_PHYB8|nr:ATP synthase F1 subcomplex delta subunit ATP16 [Phycomyces blakesleeanus NRRL 1555(-)]OAD79424.1 ATP synthase F1 subcomplex delta subunit ATP16 [Phycomyces blakesleeanus NRRL 1555(-)]|eukprot:XP_018297464.1 ATP synthase F1 subcomplex delta subunit ATP16 [Phycomyces blakesleeanus NRRL 1555(-)]